jgi:hypothetical protein
MGIDIDSKLMLVPTYQKELHVVVQELADEHYDGDFYDALDNLGLEYASPWYDADVKHWDIGVAIPAATFEDIENPNSEWHSAVAHAQILLEEIVGIGVDTKLDSFKHVW